jgi:hypothetical protein
MLAGSSLIRRVQPRKGHAMRDNCLLSGPARRKMRSQGESARTGLTHFDAAQHIDGAPWLIAKNILGRDSPRQVAVFVRASEFKKLPL